METQRTMENEIIIIAAIARSSVQVIKLIQIGF